MKLKAKQPITTLGKASLLLIALAFAAWLFVGNAQHCLARDFVEKAPPAICWRASNDYESTIRGGQLIYLGLLTLAIICGSATLSRPWIRRSRAASADHKKTAWFLTALSILLLTFVVTVFEVWQKTEFNNNNYFLNTATDAVLKIGLPLWLAVTTMAITYWLRVLRPSNTS